MNKTLEQAVHDALWKICKSIMSDVYENRPMMEVVYPFTDFEEFQVKYNPTKNGTTATVSGYISQWFTDEERSKASAAGESLFRQAMKLKDAYGYPVSLRVSDSGIEMIHDKTVMPSVWRCRIALVFEC